MFNDIDYALVERKRPPMYTAMKYWGKKPHNIWNEYIKAYTLDKGLILDPFAGSAISAFEAVKNGKKGIAFDINPLTSFIIEVYSTQFEKELFTNAVYTIIESIENDNTYKKFFGTTCSKCGSEKAMLQHAKWEGNTIYEIGLICLECKGKYLSEITQEETRKVLEMGTIKLNKWVPDDTFHDSPSFSDNFIKNIGGDKFSNLWTHRNLFVLSEIFDRILEEKNESVKKQLLFGFIQCVHLSSKMCIPRNKKSNRGFSTSWGRSAYFCSKKQMEMNPLLLFKNSCLGKQSVESALKNVQEHIGKIPVVRNVETSVNDKSDYDILYGIVDIKDIGKYLDNNSVDFIITDPPYGGLVQYLDLSYIWLVWLKKYDSKFSPAFDKEIVIKKGKRDMQEYSDMLTSGFKNLYEVLKSDGKIVFTFHNKDLEVWNAFLCAIKKAGFIIEKVIHQQNKRTGESNVADPYGTSASDFYIRCIKGKHVEIEVMSETEFEEYMVEETVALLKLRNEPTPYQILFNGLLAKFSESGYELNNFDKNIESLLSKYVDTIFNVVPSKEKHGNLWWLKNEKSTDYSLLPLSERVENFIESLFLQNYALTEDEIFAEVFRAFPNGLTPDQQNVKTFIQEIAIKYKKMRI